MENSGSVATSLSAACEVLEGMFTELDPEVIRTSLEQNKGDMDRTIDFLLVLSGSKREVGRPQGAERAQESSGGGPQEQIDRDEEVARALQAQMLLDDEDAAEAASSRGLWFGLGGTQQDPDASTSDAGVASHLTDIRDAVYTVGSSVFENLKLLGETVNDWVAPLWEDPLDDDEDDPAEARGPRREEDRVVTGPNEQPLTHRHAQPGWDSASERPQRARSSDDGSFQGENLPLPFDDKKDK